MPSQLLARRSSKKLASLCAPASSTLSLGQLPVGAITTYSQTSILTVSADQLSNLSDGIEEEEAAPWLGKASFEAAGYAGRRLLGSGSMATVFRVTRCSDGKDFAAKRVRSLDEEYHAIARVEFEIMRDLSHSSIVRATELVELPHELWIVQELCGDGDVAQYVQKHGAFPERTCMALSFQLVGGIEYLHGKRVLHRDIKPANLFLLDAATTLKIGDFNSAIQIRQKEQPVWMLSPRGTPNFLAPEMRFGDISNETADIWPVGLSIFFLAKAALPFDAMSREATSCLKAGQLPTICWGGMPDKTKNLVLQCLTVRMQDRPPAMELKHHPAFDHLQASRQHREGVTTTRGSQSFPPSSAMSRTGDGYNEGLRGLARNRSASLSSLNRGQQTAGHHRVDPPASQS